MKLTHKQKKIWFIITAIATIALLLGSLLPLLYAF